MEVALEVTSSISLLLKYNTQRIQLRMFQQEATREALPTCSWGKWPSDCPGLMTYAL